MKRIGTAFPLSSGYSALTTGLFSSVLRRAEERFPPKSITFRFLGPEKDD